MGPIRLKDCWAIKQEKAANDISQNFELGSKKSQKLLSNVMIKIKGGDYVADRERYKCKSCGLEWYSPEKEYKKCPECESEYIYKISAAEETQKPTRQPGMGRQRGYGMGGIGAGPPRVCKCSNCGYESPKSQGVPCRNTKCPECGTQLCGAD